MSTLGRQIDRMYLLDQQIDRAEAQVKKLKQERAVMEAALLRKFGQQDIDGCKGARGVAAIQSAKYPSIKDRRKFERYVIKNRAFDLFQSRITSSAYFDRLEEGEEIPGVSVFERVRVSIRRRKR